MGNFFKRKPELVLLNRVLPVLFDGLIVGGEVVDGVLLIPEPRLHVSPLRLELPRQVPEHCGPGDKIRYYAEYVTQQASDPGFGMLLHPAAET